MKKIVQWMKEYSYWVLLVLLVVAFGLGVYGLKLAGLSTNNAIFNTLTMYFLNFTDEPVNIWVNLARYIAALFTLVAIVTLLQRAIVSALYRIKASFSDSVYIYGKTSYADSFEKAVGTAAIRGDDRFVNAKRFVLLGDEKKNLEFLDKYKEKLEDKKVYIKSDAFSGMIVNHGKHRFFSIDELVARQFWKEYSLEEIAFEEGEAKPELHIIMMGFDSLGEELLYQSLQTNIFDCKQILHYHLFGETLHFQKTHKNLEELHIHLHGNEWVDDMDVINNADRILMTGESVISTINDLVRIGCETQIDAFCEVQIDDSMLDNHRSGGVHNGVRMHNYIDQVCTPDFIIDEENIQMAKELNLAYENKYNPKSMWEADALWSDDEKMNTFIRYSNISAVDYYRVLLSLTKKWKCDDYKECLEKLAELEHMRWCNYYWYNNWTYDERPEPLNLDATKNYNTRTHKLLKPYEKLDEMKNNDREQIRILFEEIGKNKYFCEE